MIIQKCTYPAVNRVAAVLEAILAFCALSSEIFLKTYPSPSHSEQRPEPQHSSQTFMTSVYLKPKGQDYITNLIQSKRITVLDIDITQTQVWKQEVQLITPVK
jgi:hypothetical protein